LASGTAGNDILILVTGYDWADTRMAKASSRSTDNFFIVGMN
jgi:hypothetical protein